MVGPRQQLLDQLAKPYRLTPQQIISVHLDQQQWLARFQMTDGVSCDLPLTADLNDYLGAEAEATELATADLLPLLGNPDSGQLGYYANQGEWYLQQPCCHAGDCEHFSLLLVIPKVPHQLWPLFSQSDQQATARIERARARASAETIHQAVELLNYCPGCLSRAIRQMELTLPEPALWYDTIEQRWQLWTPFAEHGLSFPLDLVGFAQPLDQLIAAAQAIQPDFQFSAGDDCDT